MRRNLLKNVLGTFGLSVPVLALLALFNPSAPFESQSAIGKGVEVAAVSSSDGEVVELTDWQDTSCCCAPGYQAMNGLGNWRYTGSPRVVANASSRRRSPTTRPTINIFIVNVNGGSRAYGSRGGAAAAGGSSVNSVSVQKSSSRFQDTITFRNPRRFRKRGVDMFGSNGFNLDIQSLFNSLILQQVNLPATDRLDDDQTASNFSTRGLKTARGDELQRQRSALLDVLDSRL